MAAADLDLVGENAIFQLNFLISEGESLGSSWRDPQYEMFMDRLIEYREQIEVYRRKNVETIAAIQKTAHNIKVYLDSLGVQ
jgi:hypothetical protein